MSASTVPALRLPCSVCSADAWHLCYDCRAPLCAKHRQLVLLEASLGARLQQVTTQVCRDCLLRRLRTPSAWRMMIIHP